MHFQISNSLHAGLLLLASATVQAGPQPLNDTQALAAALADGHQVELRSDLSLC